MIAGYKTQWDTLPMNSENQIYAHIAQIIKQWRKSKKMSQSALAERLGMHQTAIAKIENNERRIDFATVTQISEILEIPWSEFQLEKSSDEDQLLEITTRIFGALEAIDQAQSNLMSKSTAALATLTQVESEVAKAIKTNAVDLEKWGTILERIQNILSESLEKVSMIHTESLKVDLDFEKVSAKAFNTTGLIKRSSNASS